ncbi:GntR family transcriptional regulator [Amycolatopsis sp. NPDC049252]|uniref:GntR family transcriptional regulator n=1 Tax=Amycolatopsis sp. NPDC049252 TaxID=3363933 RepID=UPI003712D5B6
MDDTSRIGAAPRRAGDDVIQVHARLRSMILDCTLEPGSKVTQAELSRLTDAGRTPLREALRMLQQEGLVKAELNKRITIAAFDLDKLDCTYAYRISIEAAAIRVTASLLSTAEFDELDRTLVDMGEAIERRDRDEFEGPHRRFHQMLVSHVQEGARARMAIDADWAERVRRFVMQGDQHSLARADAEHREILEACRARDGVRASRLLASHLARSAFYVAAQLEPTYDTILTRTALRMVLGDELAQTAK